METAEQRLARWTRIHEKATMVGWDFSSLDGRLEAEDPPWDFEAMSLEAMRNSTDCLDMGTGGGERLISLLTRLGDGDGGLQSRTVSATEGWAPNIPLATSALEEFGVEVRAYDSGSAEPLPWPNGAFDLVMNRHESFYAAELARVIRPGGIFLTQQVDGTEAQEFRDWFGGETMHPEVTLEPNVAELEAHGFFVTMSRKWAGTMIFTDAEAIIEYLGYVPWDAPEFSVTTCAEALENLAARQDLITVTQKRFVISAERRMG